MPPAAPTGPALDALVGLAGAMSLLLSGCATTRRVPEPAPAPHAHVGEVTAAVALRGVRFTCSRAGVFAQIEADSPRPFWQPPFRVVDLAACEAGPWLLAAGGQPARSGTLAVLGVDGSVVAQARIDDDMLYATAASPDGRLAACGGADGNVWLLALPALDQRRIRQAHGKPCRSVAFSADGQWLASGGRDGLVLVAAVAGDGSPLAIRDHTAGVEDVRFTARGTIESRALDGRWREHDTRGRQLRSWVEPR